MWNGVPWAISVRTWPCIRECDAEEMRRPAVLKSVSVLASSLYAPDVVPRVEEKQRMEYVVAVEGQRYGELLEDDNGRQCQAVSYDKRPITSDKQRR